MPMNQLLIKLVLIAKNMDALSPGRILRSGKANPAKSSMGFPALLELALASGRKAAPHKMCGGVKTRRILSTPERKPMGAGKMCRRWLDDFRDRLASLGVPLNELLLSSKALPDLKKLLIGEGYSESEVTRFLKMLFEEKPGQRIKISEFFRKLSQLGAPTGKKPEDPDLEVSDIPCLEVVLRSLGLDAHQAKRAIERARTDGGGLNLRRFIQELKPLVGKLPQGSGQVLEGKEAENIKGMLPRSGVVDKPGKVKGPLSLRRFVQILEEKVASLMPPRMPAGEKRYHVNRLLENVSSIAGKSVPNSQAQHLYSDRSKAVTSSNRQENNGSKRTGKGPKESLLQPENEAGRDAGRFQVEKDEFVPRAEKTLEAVKPAGEKKVATEEKAIVSNSAREGRIARAAPLPETSTGYESKPVPLYIVDQVGKQISLALQRGDGHIRLRLKPPELGSIQISMNIKDNTLKVGMITESHSVKELLVSHVPELRHSLLEQGIRVDRIDIQISYDLGQSMANDQRGLKEAKPRQQRSTAGAAVMPTETAILEGPALSAVLGSGLVDMFA